LLDESISLNYFFAFYELHWDTSKAVSPFISRLILTKLEGILLFYLSAVFIVVRSTLHYFFVKYGQDSRMIHQTVEMETAIR
jgi:hypothetical protein